MPRPLFTPGKEPVPIVQETGWAPGPVWTRCKKSQPPPGIFFVQGFYCSIQSMCYIRLADGQLGIQRLRSQYCYFTYFIVLARYYAPFFVLVVTLAAFYTLYLTHCGRVRQICVFNTVKLGTSASSPQCHSTRRNVSRSITPSSTTRVFW